MSTEAHAPRAPGPAIAALHPTANAEGEEIVAAHSSGLSKDLSDEKIATPHDTSVDVEAYRSSEDTEEARQSKISEGWNAFRKSKASRVGRDMFIIALIVS